MKFGGAAVASPEHFSRIADIIISRRAEFQRIVIVVSAMANTTDQLIALAKKVNQDPPRREYDMLVTVGERISCSLLAMALAAKGCQEAMSFTGSQAGIITCTRHSEAKIVDVRPARLLPLLDAGKIIVVAGFQGVSRNGEITTLGRGGSDTTAVALGIKLQANIEFFKDVPGIFEDDPKKNPQTSFHEKLTYEQALNIISKGGKILHHRCIQLAHKNYLPLKVRSFETFGTEHEGKSTLIFEDGIRPPTPLFEEEEI